MSEFNRGRGSRDVGRTGSEERPAMESQSYEPRPENWASEAPGSSAYSTPSVKEEYASTQERVTEKAREVASEYGQKAQETVETGKQQAATGMLRAAETIRERSEQRGGIPSQAGTRVAERMESAASYLQAHSNSEIWQEVEHYVREHPTRAVVGAVFAGYLLGRILR